MVMLAGRRFVLTSDQHAARHAEMDQHRQPAFDMDHQIFGAARQALDAPAGQAFDEQRREGAAKIGPALRHAGQHSSGHRDLEAKADGFDFGKLGHDGPSIACQSLGCNSL